MIRSFFMRPIVRVPMIVWCVVFLYCVLVIGLCIFQYTHFLYSGYDLGIYNQVLWNTVHGRWFAYSFAPYSYLVDHREWALLFVAPVYALFQHPITLLVVQTLVIASTAFPLYALAKNILPQYGERAGVCAVLLYLLNPSVVTMNLYEFHLLPFAMPLICWGWLAVERQRLGWAVVCVAGLLLVREDVALMLAGAAMLFSITQKRRGLPHAISMGVVVLLLCTAWFLFMVWVGAMLSPDQMSKFFVYYQWLGQTPMDAARTAFTEPLRVLGVFFGRDHSALLLFLAASVGFLCLAAPLYLLPLLGPLALYLLIDTSMLSSLNTHYAAVLVPWCVIAALYGFRNLGRVFDRLDRHFPGLGVRSVAVIVSATIVIAQCMLIVVFGDLARVLQRADAIDQQTYQRILSTIPSEDAVMASDRLYSRLSNRESLYPVLHLFTGVEHYSHTPYTPPEHVDWLVLENESLMRFGKHLGFGDTTDAWQRLQQFITEQQLVLVDAQEDVLVYHRDADVPLSYPLLSQTDRLLAHGSQEDVNEDVTLTGWEFDAEFSMLLLSFEKQPPATTTDDIHMELVWYDAQGKRLAQKKIALGAGVYPTHAWRAGERLTLRLPITVPVGAAHTQMTLGPLIVRTDSFFVLSAAEQAIDEARSAVVTLSDFEE